MELTGLMEIETFARLLLIYAHFLLSVFALRNVLSNDWKVLQRSIQFEELMSVHRQMVWLLSALWITGLSIIAIDVNFDPEQLADKPKILVKLLTVGVLTGNGLLLYYWCFPRIINIGKLGMAEVILVMSSGAVSTASWLMATFLGIAKPLATAPVEFLLGLYGIKMMLAVMVAALLAIWWKRHPERV
jgi:hypothetical protein